MAKRAKAEHGNRKSRAEGYTGAKENSAEVRTGDLALGPPVVLNDDDFDLHYRALKNADERRKQGKNLYDGACKAAKKVGQELLDAVKRALKFDGMDPADIKRQMEIDGYVLKRRGAPVQLTVHDVLEGDPEEAAYKKGHDDGANGRGQNNPYPDGSALAEAYITGWRNATGSNLGLTNEQTNAALAAAARNGSAKGATA